MEKKSNWISNIDWGMVAIYLLLVVVGWFSIVSATSEPGQVNFIDLEGRAGAQLMWVGITFLCGIFIFFVDTNFIKSSSWFFYGLMLVILAVTIVVAPDIKGSRSWLVIGPIRLQPAEFAKITTAMALAAWMARYDFDISKKRDLIISLVIFMVPVVLIILQSETGSAIAFFSLLLVLYREGLRGLYLVLLAYLAVLVVLSIRFAGISWGLTDADAVVCFTFILLVASILAISYFKTRKLWLYILLGWVVLSVGGLIYSHFKPFDWSLVPLIGLVVFSVYCLLKFLIRRNYSHLLVLLLVVASIGVHSSVDYFFYNVLQPHQQVRIRVTLGLEDDPRGTGYNVNQSKIAIGSGGLKGKGFQNGTQTKLKYVPEQETDFIFSTVGEEQGFRGAATVLLLFLLFVWRLLRIAERQPTIYGRVFGYSVASYFIFHIIINIGMVLGLTPVIGIPLPFFSYGGSSFLSFSLLLFILLKIDSDRNR